MESGRLLPDIEDEDGRPFWQAASRGELVVQSCGACRQLRFPPRPMCPRCQSIDQVWVKVSGRGKIWSWVLAHPPLLPAYAELAPYPVVVVSLEEDPSLRMVGNLVARPGGAINEVSADTIEIGANVSVVFEDVDGVAMPRWIISRT